MTMFFKFLIQKHPKKTFLLPNLNIFFFHKNFQLGCFESADSNVKILFSNSSQKNTALRYFWSQMLGFRFLYQTLQYDKFSGLDLYYENSIFKSQPKNIQIRHFWSKISILRKSSPFKKIEGGFKYDNVLFNFQSKYTEIKYFWFQI